MPTPGAGRWVGPGRSAGHCTTAFGRWRGGSRLPRRPSRYINAAIADSPPMFVLAPRADGIAFTIPAGPFPDLLRPVLHSALHLLSSPDLARLRECAAERCGKLYLDHTKNASRRWCDMDTCGNRAKARRHQARRRHPLP